MNQLHPVNYKIHLEPDLANFRFNGTAALSLQATGPVNAIKLNCLDLAFWRCKVRVDENFFDCAFSVSPETEELRILLPGEMTAEIDLRIDYEGNINDKMVGFYRSKYDVAGTARYIAVTQFQESEARRAFPCMDHPEKKATFEVAMTVDENLVAISNGTVREEIRLGNGKKRVAFHKTPKMSTYLLFFGVGTFDFVGDSEDFRVRAATLPGMTRYAGFGLAFGRKSLRFCEDYYGIPYPLPKLDLIAIPDFAFGAMENWGAITFRENLLLHYPDITSKLGEERICEVIAHEIAHQWFGNLVTPSDWKYLWLNESFATYFGYGVVNHYYPQWEIWAQFLNGQTDVALGRDALHETFPIEIPGGEHVVINTSTAPIIYNKGGSILRQIEGYIGTDNFRQGLQQYLEQHAYACASSHHLWEAFENVSDQPVTAMMKGWIEQPGFPMVDVQRDGQTLILTQKRFTYLPQVSDAAVPDQEWLIPLTIRLFSSTGEEHSMRVLLEGPSTQIDIDPQVVAYKFNDGQTGFYRVRYDSADNLEELGKRVRSKALSPEDRWGLQNDLYALVKGGQMPVDEYLDFLAYYENEDAFLPLTSIAGKLFHAFLIRDETGKGNVQSVGRTLLEKVLARIGYEPAGHEPHTTSILRDQIIWQAALYGSEDVTTFARDKFRSLVRGDAVHPDIVKSIMQVGALLENEGAFTWLDKRFHQSESEHERLNILYAIGCFSSSEAIDQAQQWVLDKVPGRNKFIPIVSMASNPHAVALMWDWYVTRQADLEQFHPMLYERVIAGIVPVCGMGKAKEVRDFLSRYVEEKEQFKDVIRMSLEKLEINLRMRSASPKGSRKTD